MPSRSGSRSTSRLRWKDDSMNYSNYPRKGATRRQTPDYRYHLTHDLLTNLHRGECCAVVGVGSCGKSRLLKHLARPEKMENYFSDGGYHHLMRRVACESV